MSLEITNNKIYGQRIIYTVLVTLLVWSSLFAQQAREATLDMSLGGQNGYYIDIDGVEAGFVEDVWNDYLKDNDYGKTKRNKKAKEYYGNEISIPMVSGGEKFSLYAKFLDKKGMVTVETWADMGGYFVNMDDYPKEAKGMMSFLEDFYLTVKRESFEEEYKQQEKQIKKSNKHLDKLVKKNKGLHDDIEDLKKKIIEKEEAIEKNLVEQEDQRMLITKEETELEKIKEKINNLGKK